MEFSERVIDSPVISRRKGERVFASLREKKSVDETILARFAPEQKAKIQQNLTILSSLAHFIGKDFDMPVGLNEPGQGWLWDFEANEIKVDPVDLLEKEMDYLRFVICHEGGHRRISRTEFIPLNEWNQPGFAFMMNAIEDPRDNNFVADSYPKFREHMTLAYQQDIDFEGKAKDKAGKTLGQIPRFMQAGFEYIKQWFREVQGQDVQIDETLPDEVKKVVLSTLEAARDSWWRYPSREEADRGEELITKYGKVSYEINRDEVWPTFKKLIEEDIKDQAMQEALQDMKKGEKPELPSSLKDKLSPSEQKALEEALQQAIHGKSEGPSEKASEGKPIDLASLSEEMKQKIKDYIESLPPEVRRALEDKAKEAVKAFEETLNQELEGKMADNPERKAVAEAAKSRIEATKDENPETNPPQPSETRPANPEELEKYRQRLQKELKTSETVYDKLREEVLPVIDRLENDLREIFVARRARGWKSGFKTGKRINIKHRLQEKAKRVPAVESRAWQKRELPQEKDYAITLLNDLSGSMQGTKIREDLKAKIAISEALNRLSINIEILGFNQFIHEYQTFGEPMTRDIRDSMGGMLEEVSTGAAQYNDDGWALTQASARLAKQKADQKFLIVLSDGLPEESSHHSGPEFDLDHVVKTISEQTDQYLIGLGLGSGTEHVSEYYPNSIANVPVEDMAERLADVIKEAIEHYDSFA